MNNINMHILVPNKDSTKFFGVDYFLDILSGNNPLAKYYSTSLDHNPVYKPGPISLLPEMYDFLDIELSGRETNGIIGIQTNPDIYSGINSIARLLDSFEKFNMGLFLETNSAKLIDDLPRLVDFAKKLPLLIAIPVATIDNKSKLFSEHMHLDNALRIIQKIKAVGLKVGIIIKPVVPFINDGTEEFMEIINKAISFGVDFVYPALSIKFDSKKIKAFYDIIDLEYPENMVKYRDIYGMKFIWESPNLPELKKNFVITCRKHKVLYAMKDIINLYKPDLNIQLKLF